MTETKTHSEFNVALNIGASQTRIVVGHANIDSNEILSGFSNHGGYNFGEEDAATSGRHSNRSFHIFAAAEVPHNGIRRGTMVDLESIAQSILEAVDEVERQSGLELNEARVSFASTNAVSENFTESIALKSSEVKSSDRERLLALANGHTLQAGFEQIATLTGHYIVDGRPGIINPVGMYGNSLGALYHRIAAPDAELQNIIRAVNQGGLHVESVAFESLASAESALDSDEREMGSVCINFGAHLSHVVVYSSGTPIFSKDFPFGAHHITKDIAIGLRTTQTEAERIKRDFAQGYFNSQDAHETFTFQTAEHLGGMRQFTRGQLMHIVEPRVREIFGFIHSELKRLKVTQFITKGVVLTGGGSLMPGLCWIAEDIFGVSARVGYPLNLTGVTEGLRSPLCTSTIGLLSPVFASANEEADSVWKMPRGGLFAWARSVWDKLKEPNEI
ncbi:cell division protein FtsA [bacterium]|nr:cell division protein FtsA [bacterium]